MLLKLAVVAIGIAAFSFVFRRHLSEVPAVNYETRDDAVITASHARNLVEYGFIGVSPSGERVEGFSAPLQFWVNALVYASVKIDYKTFFRWQTEVGTLLLGLVFTGLFLFGPVPRGTGAWRLVFVVIAVVASAEVLARSRAFLLWHASGMENPYKHVLLIGLLWVLDLMLRKGQIRVAAILVVVAAALARIDGIVPVSILLGVFAALWRLKYGDNRALRFVVVTLIPWALYMGWRWWYFGQWEPNTGVAQGISPGARVLAAVHAPLDAWLDNFRWTLRVGPSLQIFQLAFVPALVLLLRRNRTSLERCALVLAGVIACVAQYALFGPARMDEARTVTEMACYCTALVPFMLSAQEDFGVRDMMVGLTMLGCALLVVHVTPPNRNAIGWSGEWFEANADKAETIAREHGIFRPTLAIADLGAVSWRKRFNILDLGRLGSSVTARLPSPVRYLSELAKPDIVEIHDAWSCGNRALFTNRAFVEEYAPVAVARTDWLAANCAGAAEARSGFWVRRAVTKGNGSAERVFLDAFERVFDVELARAELLRCVSDHGVQPCGYVGRTLFRFVPELKRNGHFEEIATLLAGDPRFEVEHAYFTSSSRPLWWQPVVERVWWLAANSPE